MRIAIIRVAFLMVLVGFPAIRCQADAASAKDEVLLGIPLKPQLSVLNEPKAQAWGFIDLTGRVVVPPAWDYVEPFWKGHAFVIQNGKWGIIDGTGKVILKPQWDQILYGMPNGQYVVKKDGKCGVIDADGNPVGPFVLDERAVEGPCEGLTRVWKGKKVGFIDAMEKVVIEPQWDEASVFTDGFAMVVKDGKEGIIDHSGKLVVDLKWDHDNDDGLFSEGLANVKLGGKWGFIDKTGNVVLAPQWDHARSFSNGLAQVEKNKKWGFIDRTGREVVAVRWDYACLFSDGLSMVQLDNKRGFVDETGKVVFEPQWKSASRFSEGLAAVEVGGKVGFVDKSGKMVIPPQWDLNDIEGADDINFRDGRAEIRKDGHIGLIDTTGKVIVAPEWDTMQRQPPYFNSGCFVMRFADHSFKMPSQEEIRDGSNGQLSPAMEARLKLWQSYQPAEAAWFDRDGKMIWHSWP
jgi:hypothetical protein